MYEPCGMFPGIGMVGGGAKLAVGSHESSVDDDDGARWTSTAPFGITTTALGPAV
jgi:hypothetical protein